MNLWNISEQNKQPEVIYIVVLVWLVADENFRYKTHGNLLLKVLFFMVWNIFLSSASGVFSNNGTL